MASHASSVAFPASDPVGTVKQAQIARPPHLPFRRISLPSAPTLLHRNSVLSVSSIEDGELSPHRPSRARRHLESPVRRPKRREGSSRPGDPSRQAKARRIVDEFHETEKAYVKGLEMVYSQFLVPIIESLDTPEPLLDRPSINSIFSNFIDIWNLHRSFLTALDDLLSQDKPLKLSTLLLSHFPYLSLYNPFITAFPSILTALTEVSTPPTDHRPNSRYNAGFSQFLTQQEADPRCGKLKLRDWLLTIVQRCPRYLLLLKDLIAATGVDDPEHTQLIVVHGLVSKITAGLNKSLHNHAETLALLALQRATSGLPLQLISPGRVLVKRGTLFQVERSSPPRPREFLLFSDCLIWLASAESSGSSWDWEALGGWSSSSGNGFSPVSSTPPRPPPLLRNRSRSEAELPRLGHAPGQGDIPSAPATPIKQAHRRSYQSPGPRPPSMAQWRGASSSEEKWIYKGKVDVIDIDVTVGSVQGEEYQFEILNPEESFMVYAESEHSRDEWVSQIRLAKENLLASLNASNPNSTLTSSSSTNHIRRTLQALPFHPSDDRLGTLKGPPTPPTKKQSKSRHKEDDQRRRRVEHWVPPVWIPDGKTNECMRCGKLFGWRRRRHHCRLCGRCVCSACSGRTFYIADPSGKDGATKQARACDVCYESVFPVIENSILTAGGPSRIDDSINSLSKLQSWLSIPSATTQPSQPQSLMAIDSQYSHVNSSQLDRPDSPEEKEPPGVIRLRSHQKIKSYHELVEEFEAHERGDADVEDTEAAPTSQDEGWNGDWGSDPEEEEERRERLLRSRLPFAPTPPHSLGPSPQTSPAAAKRREDTVRRRKRFSLPAVALQTAPVTARASLVFEDDVPLSGHDDISAEETPTRQRRFSLVLSPSKSGYGNNRNSVVEAVREEEEGDSGGPSALGKSLAANKLSELLERNSGYRPPE